PVTQSDVREAPLLLLVPQFVLIVGIIVLSFFPKLLIDPVSAAIDPQFASTLVWEGMSLESIYGFWNPTPVVIAVLAVTAVLFALSLLFYRRKPRAGGNPSYFSFYRPILGRTVPPFA